MAIDIGADAIDREYSVNIAAFFLTLVEGSNPASVADIVRKIYVFLKNGPSDLYQVGAFYKTNGDVLSSREEWGDLYDPVLGTSLQVGLNERTKWRYQGGVTADIAIPVQVGDMIGVRLDKEDAATSGLALDYDAGWTHDYFRTLAESTFPYTDYTFDNLGKRIISIYGEFEKKRGMGGLNPALIELAAGVV